MSNTGSPLDDHERDQGSVSPPSSHHASRSATPEISSPDIASRNLSSLSSLPRLRSSSLPPPDMDMAFKLAFHLAPARNSNVDAVDFAQVPAEVDLPNKILRPQHPPDSSSPDAVPIASTKVNTDQVTPVREIVRLLRLQKDHQRQCRRAEDTLYRLQIATARTSRLVCAARSAQHTLAECIKSEDKASFTNLLHAFHDASEECLAPQPEVAAEPAGADQYCAHSFMDGISTDSRSSILELLTKIRHDGTFLADRLDALSQKELVDLIPDRGASRQSESMFGSSVRWSSRASRSLGFVVDAHVDMVSSYSYGSALETLMFCTWGLTTSRRLEHERSTSIWATVCAQLLSKQKPGCEKLIPAVLDVWAFSLPWPAKERLELWMLQTLQEGCFLLDQPSKQTFRARVEGRPEIPLEDVLRAEAFYAQAVDSLLDLLGDQSGPSLIPPGALTMGRTIWEKLADSPGHQQSLPQFIVTRWLCSSFLADALTLSEAHGSLTDHYVPEISRQRILRKIAERTQKAVYEVAYSWKHGSKASTEVTQRVNTIMALLQPVTFQRGSPNSYFPNVDHTDSRRPGEDFVVVSAKDVVVSINALYPQRRPASVSSDYGSVTSGLQSSASSVSGFSLFRNAHSAETYSNLFTPWSSEMQSPGAASDPLDLEQSSDAQPLHEACLELEQFDQHGSPGRWTVLAAPPNSAILTTMEERFSQVSSTDNATAHQHSPIPDAQPRDHNSSLSVVEQLLGSLEIAAVDSSLSVLVPGEHVSDAWSQLRGFFEDAMTDCDSHSDFVGAHFWFHQFQKLHEEVSRSENMSVLKSLIQELQVSAESSIRRSLVIEQACGKWLRLLKSSTQLRSEHLAPLTEANERLRDKMWYVADVRTSAAYDEARSVAAALRIMGRPKRPSRTRMTPPLRHWSGTKLASTSVQLKSEAQILELLSARPEHGGPNKLSDEQSRITAAWLERQNIDNLCKGEERLHKFCMEVKRCIESIINAPAESSTISSNALFSREGSSWQGRRTQYGQATLAGLYGSAGQARLLSLQPHLRSSDALSGSSRALSSVSSRDYLETRSPTLTNKSSMPFWSPAMTEAESPSSTTSIGTSLKQSAMESFQNKRGDAPMATQRPALDRLRERLTGLLLSDLTSSLYNEGSETDVAFWTGLGSDLVNRHFRNVRAYQWNVGERKPSMPSAIHLPTSMAPFSFDGAFHRLLQKFSRVCNPSVKLSCLYDIDRLLIPYMAQRGGDGHALSAVSPTKDTSSEISVRGFRDLFSQHSLRPSTIFRDMQYIAALLPSSTLQDTAQGKAFCNAAVAISGLKRDARLVMVETADSIIAYHSNNRGHGRSPSTAQQQRDSAIFTTPSRTSSAEDIARYSMADAAYLLQITAKEGDHVAQRELATLYLTHPELMDRIIAPFARPKEVFREELEARWRKNQDPNRCDPTTMCVAHHWMNLSSKGGDSLAKEYLRQREEMDSF
ncbi:uncharacterized protein RCC_07695 [Ramularia collo-cygni]|uniref:Uncharacterized protein n=1 Tax=Ramularia collo-cygni TaxID=112498 RepID=A0A2D3V1Z9_9PEZI|nr:uncharacterized protein RCC_07695 [Ramularia collo-cygni]CZT21828.1 uncharacterized protein RCC_07695 [Ramularia collo-cygni]